MLLFLDGMAHYDSSRVALKYSTVDTSNCTFTVTAEGRFGNCLKRVSTSNYGNPAGYLGIAPLTTRLGTWAPTASGVCGFAIKVDDFQKLNDSAIIHANTIFMVLEGQSYHVRVNLNRDGTFSLIRNAGSTSEGSSGATILAQSAEGLTEATWMYLEFKWVIHASTGSFTIRVNGVDVLSYSGNTRESDPFYGSLGVWNAITLLDVQSVPVTAPNPFLTMRICDLYLADLASADPDDVSDFLGDGTIATIRPNAVGATSGWAPTGVAANWDAVNDRALPDDETTYVATTAAGTSDIYNYEDIPASSVVKGAHWVALLRKETEGVSMVKPIVRQGSTDYLGPAQGVASIAYDRYVTQPYDLNPATGDKFTAGEINAGQFGIQKSS
jgi:hypothetical protein